MNWYKISKKIINIKNIANNIRKSQVKCYGGDDECLKATCLPSSRTLKDALIKNGYDAIVVQGVFRVDNPDPTLTEEWDVNDFENEEEMEEAKYTPLHYWVEVDNLVVDITADQFNDELEEDLMDPITIGTYSELERYIPIHKDWI